LRLFSPEGAINSRTELDLEVLAIAKLLIERRGERAVSYARYQALKAGRQGHDRVGEAWQSIADAAEQVWRIEPA
jgi:hypothetical protein